MPTYENILQFLNLCHQKQEKEFTLDYHKIIISFEIPIFQGINKKIASNNFIKIYQTNL